MRIDEIMKLIESVQQSDIDELEVSGWGQKIRIVRRSNHAAPIHTFVDPPSVVRPAVASPSPAVALPPQSEPATPPARTLVEITAPMVGTFYLAPAPDADPYVKENDIVVAGQTVCIIEAMKLMNEIPSETKGRIAEILAENGQPVEYGQPLFLVEPL
ncbi:MAG: acetyl-CoA carboxylase biotin carboxyl carrier protein [Candidatus Latescibacteria bacterium]|nr:acetyl-CoA carboxylase biotin carboxyl carrier protein [Candidatus Latescibacterota bacterium]